jgi:hypothetical protein
MARQWEGTMHYATEQVYLQDKVPFNCKINEQDEDNLSLTTTLIDLFTV